MDLQLIVYDFDGVMTDNRVYVTQDGLEFVACNRADGLGIGLIRSLGLDQLIISTETNPVVSARGAKLRLEVIQGVRDKRRALLDLCRSRGIDPARVLYVGNDVNDLEAMQAVGHRVCPCDAHASIRAISDPVLAAAGGAGVVRELADRLLEVYKPPS
jgi:3-deoxy-D-manno-octulosonate 8-phosphate phosphatase (KDO 8-P phosphatase)